MSGANNTVPVDPKSTSPDAKTPPCTRVPSRDTPPPSHTTTAYTSPRPAASRSAPADHHHERRGAGLPPQTLRPRHRLAFLARHHGDRRPGAEAVRRGSLPTARKQAFPTVVQAPGPSQRPALQAGAHRQSIRLLHQPGHRPSAAASRGSSCAHLHAGGLPSLGPRGTRGDQTGDRQVKTIPASLHPR